MKNLLKVLGCLMLLVLGIMVTSCNKDLLENDENREFNETTQEIQMQFKAYDCGPTREPTKTELQRAVVAQAISKAVSREMPVLDALRNFARETQRMGYYENEAFIGIIKDRPVPELGNQSIAEIISQVGGRPAVEALEYLCKNDPGFSILVVGPDTKTVSPKVYLDNGIDDKDKDATIPFYVDGDIDCQSIHELPTEATIVVRESEAFYTTATVQNQIDQEIVELGSICGDIVFGPVGGGDGPGPDDGGGTGPECLCERDCEDGTENIHKFRTKNDFDGGFKGKGEFLFYIILADDVDYEVGEGGQVTLTGNALNYLTKRITGVKGDYKWIFPNFETHLWDLDDDGDRIKVIMYEDDGGKTYSITPTLTFKFKGIDFSLPIEIPIEDGDDLIGEYLVEYCQDIDPNGFEYHPSAGSSAVDVTHNER